LHDAPYTFASRFEGAAGASPEEQLGAAHAGCFNQALANNLDMIDLEAAFIDIGGLRRWRRNQTL
jgi:osmotically inducible protein OsmC